jgi:hypothetical protein
MKPTVWTVSYQVNEQTEGWSDTAHHEWEPVYVEAVATTKVGPFWLTLDYPNSDVRVSDIEYGDKEGQELYGMQVAEELARAMREIGFRVKLEKPKRR